MFLLPDKDKWLDPHTGKHVELYGMSCSAHHECLEMTDKGYRKHPLPKAVHLQRGAKRGQLNADDFRALKARGMSADEIVQMNDKFMMEQLGRN